MDNRHFDGNAASGLAIPAGRILSAAKNLWDNFGFLGR
jgi:hypothetical protein